MSSWSQQSYLFLAGEFQPMSNEPVDPDHIHSFPSRPQNLLSLAFSLQPL